MNMLSRILCAVDLEKASERAFDRALSLAVVGNARLYLLHAVPADMSFSWRAAWPVLIVALGCSSDRRARQEAAPRFREELTRLLVRPTVG